MSDSPAKRLFFALWPGERVRDRLSGTTRAVVASAGGRPVPPENLHMTLAFLGRVPVPALPELLGQAGQVRAPAFELVLDELGYWHGARLLWLGSSAWPDALSLLHESLWARLETAGFARERRAFRPHLTLARLARDVTGGAPLRPCAWPVEGFSLVSSVTRPAGPVYEPVAHWRLVPED